MEGLLFNADGGYLEAIVRGFKAGLLKQNQYSQLTQCETLEDLKVQLSATDYGNFLANEPPPLSTSTIADKATQRMVDEFNYIRSNSVEPLSKFLDYLTYGYMIDNIILIITGTLHERDTYDLLERSHPLGRFDTMSALCVTTNIEELYNSVLVETPLAEYFKDCVSANDLDELHIEIIRNALYKAYLEDFYAYVKKIGGPTEEVMTPILQFEADRRTINITVNSIGTSLSKEQRAKLFPSFGRLYPDAQTILGRADDMDQVKLALDSVVQYRGFLDPPTGRQLSENDEEDDDSGVASLENNFFAYEVHLNKMAFLQQFQYGVFYAYFKLKEQEIRSLTWIAECIAQNTRNRINDYVTIF